MNLEKLSDNDDVLKYINNVIYNERLSHSYIFAGEAGMGKSDYAKYFAQSLQCTGEKTLRCGQCVSCKQIQTENHPDIIWIRSKNVNIPVEDIRTQLNNDVQIKPYSSKYKIYIIEKADKMLESAQNALLKTIEEPPNYAIIILLAENVNNLLPTILSRCVILSIKPKDKKRIKDYLVAEHKVPDYLAEIAADFSGGNIGKAIKYALSDSFNKIREDTVDILRNIHKIQINEIKEFTRTISSDKDKIEDYLDIIILWYKDIMVYKSTEDLNHILFKEEYIAMRNQAKMRTYQSINEAIQYIEETKHRLKYNVNFEVTLELMLLKLKEIGNG